MNDIDISYCFLGHSMKVICHCFILGCFFPTFSVLPTTKGFPRLSHVSGGAMAHLLASVMAQGLRNWACQLENLQPRFQASRNKVVPIFT